MAKRTDEKRDGTRWISAYGDVDITYGAVWVKDYGDYADVLEITDLESATGADGCVLVTRQSVGFYTRSLREAIQRYKNAQQSCGWTDDERARDAADRERWRANVWAAMASYGYGDTDSERVVALSKRAPDAVNEWTVDEKVSGRSGLIRYLRDEYGLSFSRTNQAIDTPQRAVNRIRRTSRRFARYA